MKITVFSDVTPCSFEDISQNILLRRWREKISPKQFQFFSLIFGIFLFFFSLVISKNLEEKYT
jgi:hypothetical protein